MCNPFPPEVFGQPTAPISSRTSRATCATRRTAANDRVGHRVEVDPPLVGLLDVRTPRVPGVKLHRRHLDGPDHAAQLGHAQLVGCAAEAREVDVHRLDPVRRALREALLVHLRPVDAVREAVQHARALAQRADDPVPHAHVVLREVELRLAAGREVDPIGARDPHGSPVDLELHGARLVGGGHGHTRLDAGRRRISADGRLQHLLRGAGTAAQRAFHQSVPRARGVFAGERERTDRGGQRLGLDR